MKLKQIAAAVGAVAALTTLAPAAHADAILFPVYKVGNGVFSFVSLNTIPGAGNVHYVWNAKVPAADGTISNTAPCVHEDASGKLTAFDLIQHSVESPTLAGGSMVDLQATFGDTSTPAYSLVAPSQGFLTVTNNSALESDFFGQMVLVDTTSGIVTAYKGLNNPASNVEGAFGNILTSRNIFNMTWYPTTEAGSKLGAAGVDTSWYVTVTGNGMELPAWDGSVTLANILPLSNVFNRDEGARSGLKSTPVRCFGLIKRSDVMTAAQTVHTANGGITYVGTVGLAGGATGALMTKIETTTALGGAKRTFVSAENTFPNLPN